MLTLLLLGCTTGDCVAVGGFWLVLALLGGPFALISMFTA